MAPAGIGDRVEGIHAVAAALAAGRVLALEVDPASRSTLEDLLADAAGAGVSVEFVDDLARRAVTTAPQGVIARCRPLVPRSLDDAVASVTPAALIVLDHVVDPRNVGAIARTAVAAGFGGIVVSERRAAPLGATAFKAAAGALEQLAVVTVSSVAAAIDALSKQGVWVVGLDAEGGSSLFGLGLLTEPVAIVVGAEGDGLSRLVRERCDVVASIPLLGEVESLNVSVAAALGVYEVARVRQSTAHS
ncbi:MAG TPA: 23S rRNA (guanosine(2251)-2'-O)-methyltransferase RlmB [Acidimicrobiia bacterium]|nr:23S rRNA (guanosine(2251)-2'-O)-methyltransferase RlmB [Acidimicrobiia bacterium]